MPNIPNTNIPGQLLVSTGHQNGSSWGGSGGVGVGLAQHIVRVALTTKNLILAGIGDTRNFEASADDVGVITSPYFTPRNTGFGGPPWNVCNLPTTIPWSNVDTTIAAKTITLVLVVSEPTATDSIDISMSATIPKLGPGQSYSFGATDYAGAAVSIIGSDLTTSIITSGGGTPDVYSAVGTIAYTVTFTWSLS